VFLVLGLLVRRATKVATSLSIHKNYWLLLVLLLLLDLLTGPRRRLLNHQEMVFVVDIITDALVACHC